MTIPTDPADTLKTDAAAKKTSQKYGRQFTREDRDALKLKMLQLNRQGWTQHEMAAEIGVSQTLINKWLKNLRERWAAAIGTELGHLRAEQADQINFIYREACEAWEKSKEVPRQVTDEQPQVRVCIPCVGTGVHPGTKGVCPSCNGQKVTKYGGRLVVQTSTPATGDPRYLKIMLDCKEKLIKLYGTEAPQKVEHSGNLGINVFDAISGSVAPEECPPDVEQIIDAIVGKAKKVQLLPNSVKEE